MAEPTILIHGGAGTMHPDRLTPAKRETVLAGLRRALQAGQRELADGRPALDAVVAAVTALEDDPSFNAGRGAVFTSGGTMEMDAAVMDGRDCRLGAVAGICGPRNPIHAALAVMEHSPHVLLAGPAALEFLRTQDALFEPLEYFATEERRLALENFLASQSPRDDADRHGTVGAVALDSHGNLAAATSTGGMTGKWPGRIGDTPIAGAGTWADQACAMSATGHGESFIRVAAAHELSARLRHAHQSLADAAAAVLDAVGAVGGDGGFIALDREGNAAMPFNSRGMYRGIARGNGPALAAIYKEALTG